MTKSSKTLFLFGLAGSGKSFLAKKIATQFGYYHYEGDDDFTPAIKQAIATGSQFTDEMRWEFVRLLADRILELQKIHEKLVVSQALYKNIHRKFLLEKVPKLELVWVKASDDLIVERINQRGGAGISLDYVKAIQANFEEPDMKVLELENEYCYSALATFLGLTK